MSATELLQRLGYESSPGFLRSDSTDLQWAPGLGHVFRKAVKDCGLLGAYLLRDPNGGTVVPTVYVCEADNEDEARRLHRLVWNQDVVPFLLIQTPKDIRFYPGFSRDIPSGDARSAVFGVAKSFNDAMERWGDKISADAIEDGRVWEELGPHVKPMERLNLCLLSDLQRLGAHLRNNGLDRVTSHSLIGKYVYLHYLRDRDILSDRKLAEWGLGADDVFGAEATLKGFRHCLHQLDEWLNGAIFPLSGDSISKVKSGHVKDVARVFAGGGVDGQLPLGFQIYDFSHIPIEMLSVIYQQFLHASEGGSGKGRGKEVGAYYTPLPLVEFMLSELDGSRPLERGMKVLDPSCGSGAFLVQCYRRLVEREREETLRPTELRSLLQEHIYGVDSDSDACRVAELSLLLALLDYVDPPDLRATHNFKLPDLRNHNIFESDFFDQRSEWGRFSFNREFDWIVGNPPWIKISRSERGEHAGVHAWMAQQKGELSVGDLKLAEAFACKSAMLMSAEAEMGLLLPAMTLFAAKSAKFRRDFFRKVDLWCVANFANLAYILFSGRASHPAAALFASRRTDAKDRSVTVYSPLVANQEASRPRKRGRKKQTWSITIDASEVREVEHSRIASGSSLPWKVAMWGSPLDDHLLRKTQRLHPALEEFASEHDLEVRQGPELRKPRSGREDEYEFVAEVVGELKLDMSKLKGCGRLFELPSHACERVSESGEAWLRLRGGAKGIDVCRPPHIVVDAARRFALFSNEFVVVPSRQIGIHGPKAKQELLRALAVFLNSDFARYHQFLVSVEWGVRGNLADPEHLKQLPIPLGKLSENQLKEWAAFHQRLVLASRSAESDTDVFATCSASAACGSMGSLMRELNSRVYELLGLDDRERSLVQDMVNVRMGLIQGKSYGAEAVEEPTSQETEQYGLALKSELDSFLGGGRSRHAVTVVRGCRSAMVCVELLTGPGRVLVADADAPTASQFAEAREKLRREHSQWFYFNRNLRAYEGGRVFILKPLRRVFWLRSQAYVDAGDIIADSMGIGER